MTPISPGEVTVEWPMPPDVYGWDTVLFERDVAGDGAVDVYVQEYAGGTWSDIAGPVRRGDAIPADPSNNVRYRVEITTPTASDRAILRSIYRRRKL
jgi:hypothetical protein